MKLGKIYDTIVREGMLADPRGKAAVEETLKNNNAAFLKMSAEEKAYFDRERLRNPYDDTRILYGSRDAEAKVAMVGIDIDTAELLLVDRLNAKNRQKIDLALSHHPQGTAFANFYEVMDMQAQLLERAGVPINIGEKMVAARKKEVSRKIHAANHHKTVDAARYLGLPFLCVHTAADNHAASHLEKLMEQKKPERIADILRVLDGIEEYRLAKKEGVRPEILFGAAESHCGKVFVDMTGGTEGPKEIWEPLLRAGVGTLLAMHVSEDHYRQLSEKNINVVVAGHIASDNLGMNLILDKVQKAGPLKILSCSGFRRVQR